MTEDRDPSPAVQEPPPGYDEMPSEWPDFPQPADRDPPPDPPEDEGRAPERPRRDNRGA